MAFTTGPTSIPQKSSVIIKPLPPKPTPPKEKPAPPQAVAKTETVSTAGGGNAKDEARGRVLSEAVKNSFQGTPVEPGAKPTRHPQFAPLSSGTSDATETRGALEAQKREISSLLNTI